MCVSWFVKEGANRDAHRAGNPHEARGARVDVGAFHTGDRFIVQVGASRDVG
jgi:hypothetical protein